MTEQISKQRRRILIAAIAASSMGFIDGSVTAIVTPAIRMTLDADLASAQWVANAYLLTLSSLLLLGGATSDRFGLRNVFAGGIVLFVLASLVSAAAGSVEILIVARAVQGIGAAFMVPGSLALIAATYPEGERGGAIGTWAAASSLTTLLGPVLGGLMLSWLGETSWRWIFAVNLPLGAIALLLLRGTPTHRPAQRRPLDVIGAICVSLALFLISWSFIDGADRFAVSFGAGLVVLAGFAFWEARASAPMLPFSLFGAARFSGAQATTFFVYFGLAAVMYYLPTVMISGWNAAPAEVALALLPFGIAMAALSRAAGRAADRLGQGPLITGGAVLVAACFAILGATIHLHAVWTGVLPLMVLLGVGMSGVAGPISTAVMGAVPRGETGTASAINNAVARVAGLLAIAGMGALAGKVYGAIAQPLAPQFGVMQVVALSGELELSRVAATDAAMASICYVTAGFVAVGAVICRATLKARAA